MTASLIVISLTLFVCVPLYKHELHHRKSASAALQEACIIARCIGIAGSVGGIKMLFDDQPWWLISSVVVVSTSLVLPYFAGRLSNHSAA